MLFFLTEAETELARRIATIRNSKLGAVPNHRIAAGETDHDIDFQGALGEVAVGKLIGYPPDASFLMGGDDHRPDLYLGEWSVEVKTTKVSPPCLILNSLAECRSDIFVLVQYLGVPDRVDVVGAASKAKIAAHHSTRDFGYGVRCVLEAEHLTDVRDVMRHIGETPF